MKIIVLAGINRVFTEGRRLSTYWKQAVTRSIEKIDQKLETDFSPQHWRKTCFKDISSGSEKCTSISLISSNQTAYLNKGLISEGGRLLSDVLEASDSLKMKGFLLTFNIEKVFDTVNHEFLLTVQENYGFNQDFLKWTRISLQK